MARALLPAVYREIGRRVQALREARGLTQAQLAARVHTGVASLAKIEAGTRRAGLEKLTAIAIAFDVPIEHIVPPPPPRRATRSQQDLHVHELIEIIHGLDPAAIRSLLQMAKV